MWAGCGRLSFVSGNFLKVINQCPCALAQGGPGGHGCGGKGYGGPQQTEAERAARQEQGKKANGGICGGQGKGQRRGPRDGSGPRGGGGNCPAGN